MADPWFGEYGTTELAANVDGFLEGSKYTTPCRLQVEYYDVYLGEVASSSSKSKMAIYENAFDADPAANDWAPSSLVANSPSGEITNMNDYARNRLTITAPYPILNGNTDYWILLFTDNTDTVVMDAVTTGAGVHQAWSKALAYAAFPDPCPHEDYPYRQAMFKQKAYYPTGCLPTAWIKIGQNMICK